MSSNQVLSQVSAGSTYPNSFSLFIPDQDTVLANSVAEWALLDDDGSILSSGTALIESCVPTASGTLKLTVSGDIVIPDEVPASVQGTAYTVQYNIQLSDGQEFKTLLHHESCTVVAPTMQNMGPITAMEIYGNSTPLALVVPYPDAVEVGYSMYAGNTLLYPNTDVTGSVKPSADGYTYSATFDTAQLPMASLSPYMLMWRYKVGVNPMPQTEMGKLYAVTPRILAAAQQLQQMIQRNVISVDNTVDIIFKPEDLFGWLQLGRAAFNSYGQPTDFTMTNASDQVMYFWVMMSAVNALRSQFLVESLKSFDYGGAQVTLSVDHAPAFNEMAQNLETQVAENLKLFKSLLSKRGHVTGDGNVNGLGLAQGAIGSVGITISPVSNTRFAQNGSWSGLGRLF